MKDFSEIFELGPTFFVNRGQQVSKNEFIDDLIEMKIDFSVYENTKFIMKGMIALQAQSEDEEKEIILGLLNNNHNLEVSIMRMSILDIHHRES